MAKVRHTHAELRAGIRLKAGVSHVLIVPNVPATKVAEYKLTELVEVVERSGKVGTVGGAAGASSTLPKHLDRSDKQASAFKQYINLGQDIDGAAQRHPEHGRFVDLRARLEWTSGDKSRKLSGKKVKWKAKLTAHSAAGRPAKFVLGPEKPGFGGANGKLEKTTTTDDAGWTSLRLHLSQYAGDELSVSAELDASDPAAKGTTPLKAGPYVVWRKFWYQLTKPDGNAVPTPTDAISAYDKVSATLLEDNVLVVKKTDSPSPPDRTFYPKGMTRTGSADASDVALIGGHNRKWFWGKFVANASKPVKGHLIICDGQWDPAGQSSAQRFEVKTTTQELTIDLGGARNAGILVPALSGNVVASGKWEVDPAMLKKYPDKSLPAKPAVLSGPIVDADISLPLPRTALNRITLKLPAKAPDPTKYKIFVSLKVGYGKFFGGESVGVQMLIKYGGNAAYYQTVSHEFGHGFKQVPDKRNSSSLAKHAKQYDTADGHGGVGPHCSTGSTKGAVDTGAPKGRFKNGTCIMFHQLSPTTCTQTFCADCEPHLRLQPFDKL